MYLNLPLVETSKRNLLLAAFLLLAALLGGIIGLIPTSTALIILAGAIVLVIIVRSPLAGYCLAVASFGLRDLLLVSIAGGINVHFAEVALLIILFGITLRWF